MIPRRTYIYKYYQENETPLCIYLCNAQAKNKIYIIPLSDIESMNSIKLTTLNKYANISELKEIHKNDLIDPLFLKSTSVKITADEFKQIRDEVIAYMLGSIETVAAISSEDLNTFEGIVQFIEWKHQKLLMNTQPYVGKTIVYENGIYWASLGVNIGSELNKNRPVLIWKNRTGDAREDAYSYIVIPISTQSKNKKYYMNVPITINGRECYIRIEDMRRINIRRISRPLLDDSKKIIFIDKEKRDEVKKAIKRFYIFDNQYHSED